MRPQSEKTKKLVSEEQYNSNLACLAYFACPLHEEASNCPLKNVRKKGPNEKMEWLSSLSKDTKKTLYQYHKKCFLNNYV